MSNSLAQLLTATAAEHADRPALKLDDTVLNYAVLNEAATRVAGLLKERGVAPGARVGIMLRTSRTSGRSTTAFCGPVRWSCR